MTGKNDMTGKDRLSAWLDGALDPADARTIAEELEGDAAMAETIARMRRNDDLVRAALPLEEEVPAALLERLGLDQATPVLPHSNVISLAEARGQHGGGSAALREPLRARMGGWRGMAAMAATACLVALGINTAFTPRTVQPEAAYRTLSNAAQPGERRADAVVIFSGALGQAEALRRIRSAGAEPFGQPNAAGAWKLAIPAGQRDAVLARLRAAPGVAMAEPLDAGAP